MEEPELYCVKGGSGGVWWEERGGGGSGERVYSKC